MSIPFIVLLAALAPSTIAAGTFPHPHYRPPRGPKVLDARTLAPRERHEEERRLTFEDLDAFAREPSRAVPPPTKRVPGDNARLPEGWVQRGNSVLPRALVEDGLTVEPVPLAAFEDTPGNKYPRKHTLYLNFVGATLSSEGVIDNSAEGWSTLAKDGDYPVFSGGETLALAVVQAVENDLAAYGVRVVYLDRPPKMLPYTMEMVAGQWTDTALDTPAGGVASGVDCGALNQRRVVYTFAEGVNSASVLANTASQEAAHAWGLDHSVNCDSVMSYCGGFSDQYFSTECDPLCEEQCQGAGTIGCGYVHEMYCGEGSAQQNEDAELSFLFGTSDPDLEPPTCDILSPEDGAQLEPGADVEIRVALDDDYGGMGWQITVAKDGEVIFDDIDYAKEFIDGESNAAINLNMLPEGVYEITAVAMDHADHTTMDKVTVVVGDAPAPGDSTGAVDSTGTSTGPTDESTGVMTTGDGDSSGATEGGTTTVMQDDGGEKGCACTSAPGSDGGRWLVFLLPATGWLLRRRRDRAT